MGFGRSKQQQRQQHEQPEVSFKMVDESLTETLDWKPSRQELMIMFVLGMISLMVSLDATVIVTSLSVSAFLCYLLLFSKSLFGYTQLCEVRIMKLILASYLRMLQAIVEDLKGTTTEGIWVGTAYLLSQGVAMPVLSSLSEIFGRPTLLFFSIIMFTIGSIICATSNTMGQLLAGRSIQGTGGGGVVVISMVIFTDIVPLRYRPKW